MWTASLYSRHQKRESESVDAEAIRDLRMAGRGVACRDGGSSAATEGRRSYCGEASLWRSGLERVAQRACRGGRSRRNHFVSRDLRRREGPDPYGVVDDRGGWHSRRQTRAAGRLLTDGFYC